MSNNLQPEPLWETVGSATGCEMYFTFIFTDTDTQPFANPLCRHWPRPRRDAHGRGSSGSGGEGRAARSAGSLCPE
jgi:hypothetical protein